MASNLDESSLSRRDHLRDDWMGLLHRLDRYETDLVRLPSTPRDHQVSHEQKAWTPNSETPKHHSFYRVHARPRHDR